VVHLRENHRSTGGVVELVNAVFGADPGALGVPFGPEDGCAPPVRAARSRPRSSSRRARRERGRNGAASRRAPSRPALGARRVREEPGGDRVLFRRLTHVGVFERALREAGLPCAWPGRRLLPGPGGAGPRRALRVHRGAGRRGGLGRPPALAALRPDRRVARDAGPPEALPPPARRASGSRGDARGGPWRHGSGRGGIPPQALPGDLARAACGAAPARCRRARGAGDPPARPGGGSPGRPGRRAASGQSPEGGDPGAPGCGPRATPADLADRLRRMALRPPREPEADGGAADAVSLLTVHQAKGLEWPVVFIPSSRRGRPRRSGGRSSTSREGWPRPSIPRTATDPRRPSPRRGSARRRAGPRRRNRVASSTWRSPVPATGSSSRARAAGSPRAPGPTSSRGRRPRFSCAGRRPEDVRPVTIAPTTELDPEPRAPRLRPPLPPQPLRISVTALAEFARCPRRHWFVSQMRLPEPRLDEHGATTRTGPRCAEPWRTHSSRRSTSRRLPSSAARCWRRGRPPR